MKRLDELRLFRKYNNSFERKQRHINSFLSDDEETSKKNRDNANEDFENQKSKSRGYF